MNIVWNLLRKDIRGLRIIVMLWLAWVVLQTTIEAWAPAAIGRPVLWWTYQLVSMAGPMMQFILLVVLIPLVIHQDPTVETRAFWLTRPISRKTLLVSKLGFMGLIVVLPVLLGEIIVLACNGIAGRNLMMAVPEILLIVLCRLSIIGVLAALTANFARFAIAGVSYIVAIGIVGLLASIFFARFFHYADAAKMLFSGSMMQSREVVGSVAIILVGGFVLCWQYLTRKTKASVIMAIVGVLCIVALKSAWHLDFLKGQKLAPAVVSFNPDNVSLSLSIVNIEPIKIPSFGPRKYQTFNAVFDLTGISQKRTAEVVDGNVTFKRSDGHSLRVDATGLNESAFPFNNDHVAVNSPGLWNAVEADIGKCRVLNSNPDSTNMELNAQFNTHGSEDYKQFAGELVTVSGEVGLDLFEYKKAGMAPLKEGMCLVTKSSRDRVVAVSSNTPTREIILRKQTVSLLFAGEKKSKGRLNRMMNRMMPWTDSKYLLLNRKRGEIVRCESVSPNDLLYSMTMAIRMWKLNRLDYVDLKLTFPELSNEWLKDSELVCFKKSSLGSFKKTIEMKDFLMPTVSDNPKGAAAPVKVSAVSPADTAPENAAPDQGAASTNPKPETD